MRTALLVPLFLLSVVDCDRSGLAPAGDLDGEWQWQFNANPSGSSVTLTLTTVGPTVTGRGTVCGIGPACSPGAVTIIGQCAGMSFTLGIHGGNGFVATYKGQVVSRNELRGTWTEATDSNTVIFFRK